MIRFHCSKCALKLTVEPEFAGNNVNCPGCGASITVPAPSAGSEVSAGPARQAWKEKDPANPNTWIALGIGTGMAIVMYLFALPFKKSYYYEILAERGIVNYAETFLFTWGVAYLVMKFLLFQHQKRALALDVLPVEVGREITKDNLTSFLAHVYALPVKLRDSLMVNRIRKALELFEVRQVNSEVATMMANQSSIDGARIGGSYTLVKIFIWAIPILGFIGTVQGLSMAIGNFKGVMSNSKDAEAMMTAMGGVTGGLSTAFDTTLLALIYAILLSLPMSSLQKIEEDNLNHIDAYCNEILLPRLNDGSNAAGGDMGALAEVLSASITRAHTQFLTGLDAASKMVREQAEGLDRRANENQKLVHDNFTKSISSFNETATKTLSEMGKSAGTSMETLSTTLKKATEHVGALEKVASAQQAQLDASVKETLAKLQQDSSKVIAEAMKGAISETSKAIENTFKPAVEQVNALTEAVKATAQHVGTLQKQASEHQSSVQKAMQEAVSNVQRDASKVLEESIKASASQSSKAIEESIKPAMQHLASIGETAKAAVAGAAALQKQAQEQHAAGQRSFTETTERLQKDLAKGLEDAIRPAAQQLGSLGDTVKAAAQHVANLERSSTEQQAAMQKQVQEQYAAGQRSFIETTERLQKDLAKGLEDAVRPAAQILGSLGESVKAAAQHVGTLERNAAEQQAAMQRAMQESIARVQEDASRTLAESIRNTASQSAKAMEEVMRPAVSQLAAIGETAKNAVTEATAMQKQAREQHAAGQQSFIETTARLQRDLAKSLEDTVRPAAQQLTTLAEAVKGTGSYVAGLEKQAREQQVATERAMQEATAQLQRDAARGLEEALRPAAQQLASLGEAMKNAIGQMSQLERTGREQQTAAQQASLESNRQMQRDAIKGLDDSLRPVAQQLGTLSESVRAVTGQLGGLDRAAQDAQASVARSVESGMSKVQQDVARASTEAMQTANAQLGALQKGITALNETLVALGGKQIIIQQAVPAAPAKGGVFSRMMGKS